MPISALEVLRGGLRIVWRFVKAHPWSFALAVTGAALFAASIIASSAVIGWVTDTAIIPVLTDGEEASEKIWAIVTVRDAGRPLEGSGHRAAPHLGRMAAVAQPAGPARPPDRPPDGAGTVLVRSPVDR